MYTVKEIFYTLQGEGINAGRPAVFCRFSGCNLWTGRESDRHRAVCQFCDTDFVGVGPDGGRFATAEALAEAIVAVLPPEQQVLRLRFASAQDDINTVIPSAARDLQPAVIPSAARDLQPAVIPSGARDLQPAVIPSGARDLQPAVIPSAARDLQPAVIPSGARDLLSPARMLVVCTGGEPLLQLDEAAVAALHARGFEVAVETNGTQPAPAGLDWICVSPKADAPLVLTRGNELKLVYPQLQESAQPERFEHLAFDHFLLQPMDGPHVRENTERAIEYVKSHPRWRLSVQTHKVVGVR